MKILENQIQQILETVIALSEGQAKLFEGQNRLFEEQAKLSGGQSKLFEGQTQIIQRLDTIDGRLENIERKVAVNTNLITTLSEDMARSVTKKDIARLEAKINLVNNKVLETEADITLLKIAE